MQQIEFQRVLEMPVSCCAYNCTKTLCEGWRHEVLQVSSWTRMPAAVGYCQVRDATGVLTEHTRVWSNCFEDLLW